MNPDPAAGDGRPVVRWHTVHDPATLAVLAGIVIAAVSPVDDTTGHTPPRSDHAGGADRD